MTTFGSDKVSDEVLLTARVLLAALFLIFGWSKLTDYAATTAYMAQTGLPMPAAVAVAVIAIEFLGSLALMLGLLTRPMALLFAFYSVATAFVGHQYWTMTGAEQYGNMINFYKNISLTGGFLLLYVTGAGHYSVDTALAQRSATPQRA